LYLNFQDTHFPYYHGGIRPLINDMVLSQTQIRPERAQELRAMYLNTAANLDRAIGEVLETTRRVLGVEPAVIVTADHGESFFEEGALGHGFLLNDAQTRIPLIVTGLPIVIEEPFGQAALRDAIGAALARMLGETHSPVVKENPTGTVFQYLGTLDRPRQIALTSKHGRTMYDFRTGLVHVGTGDWQRVDGLSSAESHAFLQLVHFWESMMLARSAKGRGAQ
jgi:hypothetical protein